MYQFVLFILQYPMKTLAEKNYMFTKTSRSTRDLNSYSVTVRDELYLSEFPLIHRA